MVEFLFLGMIRHLYYSDPLRLAPLRTMELRLLELVSEASSWDFSAALKFGIFDKSFIPRILPEKFAGNPHLQQGLFGTLKLCSLRNFIYVSGITLSMRQAN